MSHLFQPGVPSEAQPWSGCLRCAIGDQTHEPRGDGLHARSPATGRQSNSSRARWPEAAAPGLADRRR